jgi:VCBS repeat-containing protein
VVNAINGNQNPVGQEFLTPSGAKVEFERSGRYLYQPLGRFNNLLEGQIATETFTYTAINNGGFTAKANLTITVQGFNDLPADFDAAQYGASNPDLIPVYHDDLTGLTNHYLLLGRAEKRPWENFDELQYVASNTDLIPVFALDGKKATEHYLKHGFDEKRSITAFSPPRYLDSYPDLIAAPTIGTSTLEATKHYISHGFAEKRDPNLFPSDRYIASYGDLINSYRYNLELGSNHYLLSGRGEGRKVTFDPLAYIAKNPDLAGLDPTQATRHYIEHGFAENRLVA